MCLEELPGVLRVLRTIMWISKSSAIRQPAVGKSLTILSLRGALPGIAALFVGVLLLPIHASAAPLGANLKLSNSIKSPPSPLPIHKIAVFGKDDRQRPPSKYRKLRNSIGLLFNNQTSTACSAFCVAPRVIATASHCLFKIQARGAPRFSQFQFARRYDSLSDYSRIEGGRSGAAQHIMAGSTHLSVRPPIDATGDWAFVRLARPICAGSILPIRSLPTDRLQKEASRKQVFQLAYHRDYANWQLAYSKPCHIGRNYKSADWKTISRDFSRSDQLILHDCDTGGASSGSPILLDSPSGTSVVGINVGTYIQSNALVQNGKITRRYKATTIANTAVSAAAFASKLAIFRNAKILKSGEAMKQLQRELQRHSLYNFRIDGAYGRRTREAIVSFERANGMPITGLATAAILKRISLAKTMVSPPRYSRHTSGASPKRRPTMEDETSSRRRRK